MHLEPRLWGFTEGLRLRIVWAVLIGLAAVALGVARLALLGWLIGEVFAGRGVGSLAFPIVGIAAVMILRGPSSTRARCWPTGPRRWCRSGCAEPSTTGWSSSGPELRAVPRVPDRAAPNPVHDG